jgi:hypothetical protein
MTLSDNPSTELHAFGRPYEAGTVAAWMIGAFVGAVAIVAIVVALTREPATALPKPAPNVAPVALTVARSTPAPATASAPAKSARIAQADNAMREASNRSARTFDSVVLPPPAVPQGPPQPVRPF